MSPIAQGRWIGIGLGILLVVAVLALTICLGHHGSTRTAALSARSGHSLLATGTSRQENIGFLPAVRAFRPYARVAAA